jgi:hypothetical protein
VAASAAAARASPGEAERVVRAAVDRVLGQERERFLGEFDRCIGVVVCERVAGLWKRAQDATL